MSGPLQLDVRCSRDWLAPLAPPASYGLPNLVALRWAGTATEAAGPAAQPPVPMGPLDRVDALAAQLLVRETPTPLRFTPTGRRWVRVAESLATGGLQGLCGMALQRLPALPEVGSQLVIQAPHRAFFRYVICARDGTRASPNDAVRWAVDVGKWRTTDTRPKADLFGHTGHLWAILRFFCPCLCNRRQGGSVRRDPDGWRVARRVKIALRVSEGPRRTRPAASLRDRTPSGSSKRSSRPEEHRFDGKNCQRKKRCG